MVTSDVICIRWRMAARCENLVLVPQRPTTSLSKEQFGEKIKNLYLSKKKERINLIGSEENNGLVTTDPSQDKKEEGIIEFLYDIFEDNEKTEDTLSLPNEIVPQ